MEYRKYDPGVLDMVIRHPETARKDAYRLFTSFLWHRMKEEVYLSEYEESDPETEDVPGYGEYVIDGARIPHQLFRSMLQESIEDFVSASENGLTVRVDGKPYRIPRCEGLDRDVLKGMFRFRVDGDGMAVVDCGMVFEPVSESHGDDASETRRSRQMFRDIVWLVDNTEDGWERLTDMEAAAYTWGVRMCAYEGEPVKSVIGKAMETVDEICNTVAPLDIGCISGCWNERLESARVSTETQFSASMVEEWNADNGQESALQSVDHAAANDYWYDKGHKLFDAVWGG